MAIPDIENQLQEVTGALALEIDARIFPTSPWLHMVNKTTWPDAIGHSFESVVFERTQPGASQTWATHATADGSTNICNPPTTTIAFDQTRNTVVLESTAIESLDFCVDDLRAKWKRAEQMENVVNMFGQNISNIWIDRHRDNYAKVANRKVVLNATLPENDQADGDTFPLEPATSVLTNGVLDFFYAYLQREGARQYAASMSNGSPIYQLVCSMETSRGLIKQDPDTRTDFRESSQADKLLLAMGYSHTYNGFLHMIDDTPRRFDWDGGGTQWVRQQPWAGTPAQENPDYVSADHEDSMIFVKSVYDCLVPGSISNVNKAQFTAQNYVGEIQWKNILERTDNPDGKNGFFRATMGSAVRPRLTRFGIVIRHLRCAADLGLVSC
tara:strand:- start:640 stop:1791 length:1152 start_codon:yes stop_codon:yes gene_type:complete